MWRHLSLACAAVLLSSVAHGQTYSVSVLNRSLTSRPLLQYNSSSFASNTLNAAWLPLPGTGNEGGGLFFRTISAPGSSDFDNIGFVKARTIDGLHFPRVTLSNLLHDGTNRSVPTSAADPRATHRPATGDYFVTYQTSSTEFPGRHTYISQTKTPLDVNSWRRSSRPMFEGLTNRDGSPFLMTTNLALCNESDPGQHWLVGQGGHAGRVVQHSSGMCLSVLPSLSDSDLLVGLQPCAAATQWLYSGRTRQLVASGGEHDGVCLDADHGQGPKVGYYKCHEASSKDFQHQQWDVESAQPGLIKSQSASGSQCVSVQLQTPNDCGTALWFPSDSSQLAEDARAYAVATFGELRGGNLSLVSSADLTQWRHEGVILKTRDDHWDNATLSTGPAPVMLEDGNYLLLYNVDNLWPVSDPKPLPAFGRCAVGWAILDGNNLTRVIARAQEPLVYAQLPWEVSGFTAMVVYTDGVKPEGNNVFTVYAGGGDSVVEAFRIKVHAEQGGTDIVV